MSGPAEIPPPLEADTGRDLPALWARLEAIAKGDGEGRYDWLMGDAESVLRSLIRRCAAAEAESARLRGTVMQLTHRVNELERTLASAMDRIGQQSELLSRQAEKADSGPSPAS